MIDTQKFGCSFCKKEFMRERTLLNHLCEQKRRHMDRDSSHVRIGFNAWVRWHELTRTTLSKKGNLQDVFTKSSLYLAFVRFGHQVIDTKMVNPTQFIDFVITNSIKLDDWCKDTVYEMYIRSMSRREDIMSALERQVALMEKWAIEHDMEWTEFFQKVNPGTALIMIRSGKISPWILLNAVHKDDLIERMSNEQIMLIDKYIDVNWWEFHMVRKKQDKRLITEMLEEYDI